MVIFGDIYRYLVICAGEQGLGYPPSPPLDPYRRTKGRKHWCFLGFDPSRGTGHTRHGLGGTDLGAAHLWCGERLGTLVPWPWFLSK